MGYDGMPDIYRSVRSAASAEIVIKKSRFLTSIGRIEDEDEAMAFIETVRDRYHDANHNCFAFRTGVVSEIARYDDDGEPGGTAGRPILEVIQREEICNVVVVVTRYFGGVKLGAAGLVRAYTKAAKAGIDAAGPAMQVRHREVKLGIDYSWLGKLEHRLRELNLEIADTQYTAAVVVKVWIPVEQVEFVRGQLVNLTGGTVAWEEGDDAYLPAEGG